jgi:hypothetical protein
VETCDVGKQQRQAKRSARRQIIEKRKPSASQWQWPCRKTSSRRATAAQDQGEGGASPAQQPWNRAEIFGETRDAFGFKKQCAKACDFPHGCSRREARSRQAQAGVDCVR